MKKRKKQIKKGQEKECKHEWVSLLAQKGGKIVPVTAAKICLNCGEMKIGTQTIKISRFRLDMGNLPIKSVSKIYINTDGRLRIPVGTNLYE